MPPEAGIKTAVKNARITQLWRDFIEQGNPEAREMLAMNYLYLVSYIYGRIAINLPPHIDKEDIEHQGALGLLAALDNFDPTKNVKFETYASIRIRGAMIDFLRKQDILSRPIRKRAGEIERAAEDYAKRMGRAATVADLAEEMGSTVDEISDSLWKSSHSFIISLEKEVYGDDEGGTSTMGESLAIALPGPDEHAEKLNLLETMAKAIDELHDKEKQIVALYYYEELTLKEIGEVLGISESRVCQIHSRAIFNLRQKLQIGTI